MWEEIDRPRDGMTYAGSQPPVRSMVSALFAAQSHTSSHAALQDFLVYRSFLHMQISTTVNVVSTHMGAAFALDLDPAEARFLLSGSNQGSLSIHDLQKYHLEPPSQLPASETVRLQRSGELQRQRRAIKVVRPLSAVAPQARQFGLISAVQWFPADSGAFLTGDLNGVVSLYDANRMEPVIRTRLPRGQRVHAARFPPCYSQEELAAAELQSASPSGASAGQFRMSMAISSDAGAVALLDLRTGYVSTPIPQAHFGSANALDWHPSNPHLLLSAGDDRQVRVWDLRWTGRPTLELDWLQTSPSSHTAAAASSSTAASKQQRGSQGQGMAHAAPVKSARFTPSGLEIVSAGNDGHLRLWNAANGRLLFTGGATLNLFSTVPFRVEVAAASHRIRDDLLVVPCNAGSPQQLQHQQPRAAREVVTHELQQQQQGAIALVPLYSRTGRPLRLLRGHLGRPSTVVFRRSHCSLLSAAPDGLIHVWEFDPVAPSEENDEDEETKRREEEKAREAAGRTRYDFLQVLQRFQRSENPAAPAAATATAATATATTAAARPAFVPPIVRQYLDEARVSAATGSSSAAAAANDLSAARSWRRAFLPTGEGQEGKGAGDETINWRAVERLLDDRSDSDNDSDEDDDEEEEAGDAGDASPEGKSERGAAGSCAGRQPSSTAAREEAKEGEEPAPAAAGEKRRRTAMPPGLKRMRKLRRDSRRSGH